MKTYNLFISHSWSYSPEYDKLVDLLEKRSYFMFKNYSVPQHDPIHALGMDTGLRQAISQKMEPCSVVLILAGVYASYSKWINEEIRLAKKHFDSPKPIIAIEPWGSQRTSQPVKEAADKIVKWNTDGIVNAIRDLAP